MCLYASVGKFIWEKVCAVTPDEMTVSLFSPAVCFSAAHQYLIRVWKHHLYQSGLFWGPRLLILTGEKIKKGLIVSLWDTFGYYIKVIQNPLQPPYHFIFSQTLPLISMNNYKLIGDFKG